MARGSACFKQVCVRTSFRITLWGLQFETDKKFKSLVDTKFDLEFVNLRQTCTNLKETLTTT